MVLEADNRAVFGWQVLNILKQRIESAGLERFAMSGRTEEGDGPLRIVPPKGYDRGHGMTHVPLGAVGMKNVSFSLRTHEPNC